MLHTLARADLLPTHLAEVALRGADPKWLAEPEHREERAAKAREYMDVLIAAFPRQVCAPGSEEWAPVTMTTADIATMHQGDVDALEDLVLRIRTPEQVNGEVDTPAATFRRKRGRAARGADRETMADTPEPAAVGEG